MPANEVDTRFPRLAPDRNYRMIIRSPEVVAGKKDPEARMLAFKLETTTDTRDTDGGKLNVGFRFTHRVTVTPSENRDIEMIKKDLALLLKSAGLASISIRSVLDDPSQLEGKLVDVKVGVQKERDGFPESNTARFIPPA